MAGMKGPVWWVFRMGSGKIEKIYGTDLKEQAGTFEIYNGLIMTGSVPKAKVVDRWAQAQETTDREDPPSPH
jgi:hypothetical protein